MSAPFWDTSALVKLYADEVDSQQARAWDGQAVISVLALPETVSALERKARLGELSAQDAAALGDRFLDDVRNRSGRFLVMAVDSPIIERSLRCVRRHALKAYDAVQLASAMRLRDTDRNSATMASFDAQLRAAAATEGFALLPASS